MAISYYSSWRTFKLTKINYYAFISNKFKVNPRKKDYEIIKFFYGFDIPYCKL